MKPLRVTLALSLAAVAPLPAQSPAPIRVPYTIDTLPNGLALIVHEDRGVVRSSVDYYELQVMKSWR